jgi:hypothetical protein
MTKKTIIGAVLAALALVACSSTGTGSQATGATDDPDYLYGRHAGQPMRPAPDGNM